jgi:hypothetical protein
MQFFQAYRFAILFFFHVFKDELKAIVLAWYPNKDNVTHEYFAEMRMLARDETPFLSVVQLRATTLDWWLDDGILIQVDTHDHDRLACDETSYRPSNPLSILSFTLVVPLFLPNKHFIDFFGGSLGEVSRRFKHRILYFTQQQCLWAFKPFFP